jgi:hypothetical protein
VTVMVLDPPASGLLWPISFVEKLARVVGR